MKNLLSLVFLLVAMLCVSAWADNAPVAFLGIGPPAIPAGLPPTGSAGGDLTGSYPNPTIGAPRFATPGPIGSTSASTGAFTTVTASTSITASAASGNGTLAITSTNPSTSTATGSVITQGGYSAGRASFLRGVSSSADANAVLVNYFSNQTVDPAAYRAAVTATNVNSGASAGNTSITAAYTGNVGNSIAGVTLSDVRVFEASIDTNNATATNTVATGFYFKNGTNTGTTATKVGFQCEALTGTAVFAFRSAGAGLVSIGDTTDSTTTSTGSIITTGGVGAAKSIFSGGDIVVAVAGKQLKIKEGSNAAMGTAVLVAGTLVVSNTLVTANTRIFLTSQVDGGTPGFLRVSARSAGTSFTILSSSGTDTSTVAWRFIEPAP